MEVSSKGFALFVLGLICATFIGGAFRTLLRSDRVHSRIVSELQSHFPKHEFQIGETEVLLARGMWPGVALRLHSVVFKQDVCGKLSFVLTLPDAILPLDLLRLLRGQIRLNDVEIRGGEIHLDYRDCARVAGAVSGTANSSSNISASTPAQSLAKLAPTQSPSPAPVLNPPKLEWEKAAQILNGLEIRNFAITYEKNPTWKLMVKNAYVELGGEMVARAAVDVQKSLPFGELSHPVDFDLHADKRLMKWNIRAGIKEGSVHFNGQWDVDSQAARASVDLRQVPIRDFVSEMFQMGFVEYNLQLKSTWLSCRLNWEGSLQNYAATPVQIQDFRIEGGYGRADLAEAEFWMRTPQFFRQPAKLKVIQLQIQPVMEALGRQVLPAVFSRLGVWSGTLDLSTATEWQLNGDLEGVEVVFANQSLHGKQGIDRVHTHASQKNAMVSAKIDDIQLHGGEFVGHLEGELSRDWRNGDFRIEIGKLSLAPAIQRLLVGGTMEPLSAHGEGTLTAGELSQWNGIFNLSEVQGEGWKAENIQVRSNFRVGSFNLEGRAKSLTVNGSWAMFPQLRAVMQDLPTDVSWRDLSSRLEVQKTGGTLHNLVGTQVGPSAAVWHSTGSWVRDREFTGSLNVGGRAARSFTLRGEHGEIEVRNH